MICKKCNADITYDTNFCPYCGEQLRDLNNRGYDDPFKDIRISTHESQFEYQKQYSNMNNNVKSNKTVNLEKTVVKDSKSVIGLILGILSIPISIIVGYFGIVLAVVGLILTIIGFKSTNKGFGVVSIILTIITLIVNAIIMILLFVFSFTITFGNGYETTIKDYLFDAFNSGFYSDSIEGYWVNEYNQVFYLDEDGSYSVYLDKEQLFDNYYSGYYSVEEGLPVGVDEVIYGDKDYYYYQIDTYSNTAKIDGQYYKDTVELLEQGFTLKLDKDNKSRMVIVGIDDIEMEFIKE